MDPTQYNARRRPDGRLWLALVAVALLLLFLGVCHASARFAQFVSQSHTVLSLTIVKHAQAPASPHVKKAYYYNVTAREGGQPGLMGPWNSLADCRDSLGSAERSHLFACHITGPVGGNCRDLGNGFAYTKDMPFPPTWVTTDNDCQLIPIIHTHEHNQWVRLYFTDVGDVIVVIKGRPQPTLPPGQFTNIQLHGGAGPGYPWIFVGDNCPLGGGDCVWQ
jgi:hypothetical protein